MLALSDSGLLNNNVGIKLLTAHQIVVANETCVVFVNHHLPTELIWLARFAAAVQLRVRFEDAEKLVLVGNRFPKLRSPISCTDDLRSWLVKMAELLKPT